METAGQAFSTCLDVEPSYRSDWAQVHVDQSLGAVKCDGMFFEYPPLDCAMYVLHQAFERLVNKSLRRACRLFDDAYAIVKEHHY